jgi:hypothetical protein
MNRFIMEELQRMRLLSNYDNSKTLSERQISKRERQLNNYYIKNSSNVKQIQTKIQEFRGFGEFGLPIGASEPDGILGKETLSSILSLIKLADELFAQIKSGELKYVEKDNQPDAGTNQTAPVNNQTAPVDNQTAAVANKPDNENPTNAKSEYIRVDAKNGI